VPADIDANTPVAVTVYTSTAQISIPQVGLKTNQLGLVISTNAAMGPIPAVPIQGNPAIGAMLTTSLVFDDSASAYNPSSLSLSFVPQMSFAVGDTLVLSLPEFTVNAFFTDEPLAGDFFSSVSARWDAGQQLILTVKKNISENSFVNVSLDKTLAINLPARGVRLNQATLTVSTNS